MMARTLVAISPESAALPSVVLVGNAGAGVAYRMAAWSAAYGTQRFIPFDAAEMIATDLECRSPRRVPLLLKRMVKHGMLLPVEGGYMLTIAGVSFINTDPEPR